MTPNMELENTTPTFNRELFLTVWKYIQENPEEHNQLSWASAPVFREPSYASPLCGTTYCFAGHAVRIGRPDATFVFLDAVYGRREADVVHLPEPERGDQYISTLGQELLGLTDGEAKRLFSSPDGRLGEVVSEILREHEND